MKGINESESLSIRVGDILASKSKKMRVIYVDQEWLTACVLESKNAIIIKQLRFKEVVDDIMIDIMRVEHTPFKTVAIDKLSDAARKKYDKCIEVLKDFDTAFGPAYMEVTDTSFKEKRMQIMASHELSKSFFWRLVRRYLQSGLDVSSVIDGRCTRKNLSPEKKSMMGRPSCTHEPIDRSLINEAFSFGLRNFLSGRSITRRNAFTNMNLLYFSTSMVDTSGSVHPVLLPQVKRPTLSEFYYYVNAHAAKEQIDRCKIGARKVRNDKRILRSDTFYGVSRPGEVVEVDEEEADIFLVSNRDPNLVVGRPIVYIMMDVFSRAIVAIAIGFENNSLAGFTSLLINLSDDKQKYCGEYGYTIESSCWPSNFYPSTIRVDRGAEYRSNGIKTILNSLGIELQLVPPGTGSMKGNVEQWFNRINIHLAPFVENNGLIEKTHESGHKKTASMNIWDFTKLLLGFVFEHNSHYMDNYPLSDGMIREQLMPCPYKIWEYGCQESGSPRPITNKNQFLFSLMTPIAAKVSREGIIWNGLHYVAPNCSDNDKEMYEAGKHRVPLIDIRMDPRNICALYRIKKDKLEICVLNPLKKENEPYINRDITLQEYEKILELKKAMRKNGKQLNEILAVESACVARNIVKSSKKGVVPSSKNLRANRSIERADVNRINAIVGHTDIHTINEQVTEKAEEKGLNLMEVSKLSCEEAEELLWEEEEQ